MDPDNCRFTRGIASCDFRDDLAMLTLQIHLFFVHGQRKQADLCMYYLQNLAVQIEYT
jgi:hypothetical protein